MSNKVQRLAGEEGEGEGSVCKEGGAYVCVYLSMGAKCITTAATAALVYSVLYASTSTQDICVRNGVERSLGG